MVKVERSTRRSPSIAPFERLPSMPGRYVNVTGTVSSLVTPLRVKSPVSCALKPSFSCLSFETDFATKVIVGWLDASSHPLPSMCSCSLLLVAVREAVSIVMVPETALGFVESKDTMPLTPFALPLIDSRGASRRKETLLTPFGSSKS